MEILYYIRMILGIIFIIAGLVFFIIEIYGVFHFNYVLNRMHAAAIGDTMGLFLSILGVCILEGFTLVSLKFALVVLFFWMASPVSTHLVAMLEARTNERLNKHLDFNGDIEDLKED